MLKKLIKYLIAIAILIIPINVLGYVDVNRNIDVAVYLDRNGDANVTWTIDAEVASGTESYIQYLNMNSYGISNLEVNGDGKDYTILNNWNINASLKDKAYKAGIVREGDKFEICYGVNSYGPHKFIVKYTINNFILSNKNELMSYFTIVPSDDIYTYNIKVTVSSYFDMDATNTEIYGYGYKGDVVFLDGNIVMEPTHYYSQSDYITLLAKYPDNYFNSTHQIDESFSELQDIASEGIEFWNGKDEQAEWYYVVLYLVLKALPYAFLIFCYTFPLLLNKKQTYNFGGDFRKVGKKLTKLKRSPYDRNVCLDTSLLDFDYVSAIYHLKKDPSNIIGGILLKWVKNNNIKLVDKDIHFISAESITLDKEKELYLLLKDAAGTNGILEPTEFRTWNIKYNYIMERWIDSYINIARDALLAKGYITKEANRHVMEEPIKVLGNRIVGFQHFLEDFSRINEMEAIDVHLWDNYLIYATSLGLSDKIIEKFNSIYPDYFVESSFDISSINYINTYYSRNTIIHAPSSRTGSYGGRSGGYSRGGGGHSFSGGGHHSGGGGGHSGRR